MDEDMQSIGDIARYLTFHQLTSEQWKLWKAQMRRRPQWFVLGRPGWKTERWRALAGPFDTPEEAQLCADQRADSGIREGRLDLQSVYHTQVKSLTETVRMYHNDVARLVDDLMVADTYAANRVLPRLPQSDEAPPIARTG